MIKLQIKLLSVVVLLFVTLYLFRTSILFESDELPVQKYVSIQEQQRLQEVRSFVHNDNDDESEQLNKTQSFNQLGDDNSHQNEQSPPQPESNPMLKQCSYSVPNSTTRNNLDEAILSFSEIDVRLSQQSIRIRKGGLSLTTDNHKCASNTSIAIIIPYRDRLDNLKVFLNNMHPFLTRQRINYGVYLVEPKGNVTFNRGLLMNIGYVQALRDTNAALQSAKLNWTCFIFHDVDMLPEDVRNVYHCDESVPLHLAHTRDTRNYSTADYQKIYFGGVTALTGEQFARINGFSNLFFGWGMEDDNLRERVNHVYGRFVKVAPHIGRYHSESHDIQERNEARRKIFNDLESYRKRKGLTEGLATLNYTLLSVLRAPLYTHISVTYDQDFVLRSFYNRSDVRELIPSPLFNMNSG